MRDYPSHTITSYLVTAGTLEGTTPTADFTQTYCPPLQALSASRFATRPFVYLGAPFPTSCFLWQREVRVVVPFSCPAARATGRAAPLPWKVKFGAVARRRDSARPRQRQLHGSECGFRGAVRLFARQRRWRCRQHNNVIIAQTRQAHPPQSQPSPISP